MNLYLKISYSLILVFFILTDINAEIIPSKIREENINNQIIEYIFDADVIKISSSIENNFNLIANQNNESKYSILLLHGRGLYPTEPNVIDPLRISFFEKGIDTYSLQLPVLDKGKSYNEYKQIFKYSDARITSAINFIEPKKLIIVAHSCGAHMLISWAKKNNIKNLSGFILIGAGAVDKDQKMVDSLDYNIIDIPILNIYGEYDHSSVKDYAAIFDDAIKDKNDSFSKNIEIKGSGHNYLSESNLLVDIVNSWLKSL
jgi:hypothetical protein